MSWIKNLLLLYLTKVYFFFNKGLAKVYTIRDIKHKTDRPLGIVNNNAGIIISVLFSLSVQLLDVIIS